MKKIFIPNHKLQNLISGKIGHNIDRFREKDVFSLALIHSEKSEKYLNGNDLGLLSFLISGRYYPVDQINPFMPVINILDGVLDADRLDYVYRDAYHTIGTRGSPDQVIETLLRYDNRGPVLNQPGAVSDFFSLRAHLWRNVYYSPQVRYRTALLLAFLRGMEASDKCKEIMRNEMGISFHIGEEELSALDDKMVIDLMAKIDNSKAANTQLPEHAKRALALLIGDKGEHRSFWLREPKNVRDLDKIRKAKLSPELFFDTFTEMRDHNLYDPGSVRVEDIHWSHVGGPQLPLEDCGGVFASLARTKHAQPFPEAVLAFMPRENGQGADWDQVRQTLKSGDLYYALADAQIPVIPADTRSQPGFDPPAIFISFSWDNIDHADHIARHLYHNKRQYFHLRERYQGVGNTTRDNSADYLSKCNAVIVLMSDEYAAKYGSKPDENIHAEVTEIAIVRR